MKIKSGDSEFNDAVNMESFAPSGENKKQFSRSFFRGEHCNFNPYKADFENSDFLQRFLLKGWVPSERFVNKKTRITAFGSCFATHLTNHLSSIGYDLSKDRASDIYVSSMGEGLVNTHSLLQQFEWALDNVKPPENLWHGFKAEEFGYEEAIREKTRKIFLETDFFIITLGLSEVWYDEVSGGVFWRAVPKDHYDATRHKFRVCSFGETKANIEKIYDVISRHVPKAKILFTLSPVPLAATFRNVSCITASSVSKALLRSALDEFYRDHESELNDRLFYFPSYEIITYLFYDRYVDDNRHPHKYIVDFIMNLFVAVYCNDVNEIDELERSYKEMRKINLSGIFFMESESALNQDCIVNQVREKLLWKLIFKKKFNKLKKFLK